MIYSNNISQIENINTNYQISYFDNQYINNDYLIYHDNKILSNLNNYSNYNSNNNIIGNEDNKNKIINSPIIRKNKIKEEIKNFDYNEEYFKNYNFIPKQFNYDNTKNLKNRNNNKNISNNSLYDYIFPKKSKKSVYNINLINISPSRNPINYYYLTDNLNQNNLNNNVLNNNYNYKKSHSKSKEKKVKKQIIINTNYINENEEINNVPIIPQSDHYNDNLIYLEKKFVKKNHINIIQIPNNIKRYDDKTYDKKKLTSNYSQEKNRKNHSVKKNKENIDINLEFQKKGNHKKYQSLTFGNDLNDKILGNNDKINNMHLNRKKPENSKVLNKYNSEKRINSKIKIKDNKEIDYLSNNIKQEIKNRNHSPTKCKINNQYKTSKLNDNNTKDFKIFWGGKSQAGKDSKGNFKINQDSFKVCENINNIKNFNIFILCDGHGVDGHHVSQFVTENIISKIINHSSISSLQDTNQIYKVLTKYNYLLIKNIFSETDKYLFIQRQFDTYTSGTTCVLILQLGNKIICANTGDSRAILVYSQNDIYNEYKQLKNTNIFPLSLDSKPDLPSEKNRIMKCGGEVHKGKNRNGNFVGPMRVYAKGKDYPGLAMSRSLGDFGGKEYGIICEPSFVEYNLDESCKYIVLCSDGVWDFMDNENVMKVANKHYLNINPEGFCQEILDNASYWWEKEDIVIDDITALIVFFKFYL